ncbi:hypothetical protein MMC20_008017, partial [Loxospora ochrophaea]|nr:hypothetical protein [Loxospora ochrophaea]
MHHLPPTSNPFLPPLITSTSTSTSKTSTPTLTPSPSSPTIRSYTSNPFHPINNPSPSPTTTIPSYTSNPFHTPSPSSPPSPSPSLSTIFRPRPHTAFHSITIHTAKCDICDAHNESTLYRCRTCGWQLCTPCWAKRGGGAHGAEGQDLPGTTAGDDSGRNEAGGDERVKVEADADVRATAAKIGASNDDDDDESDWHEQPPPRSSRPRHRRRATTMPTSPHLPATVRKSTPARPAAK